jgi:hypothetical protein
MGTTLWSYPSEPHGRAALLGLLPRAAGRLAGLAVLFLAAACSGDEALTEPESGSRIATPASPAGTGDVRLLMSSPGLRWFQSHTHGDGKLSLGHPLLDQVAASGLDVSITGPTDLDHRFPGLTSLAEEINASGQIAGSRFLSEGAHTPDAIRWNANGQLGRAAQEVP